MNSFQVYKDLAERTKGNFILGYVVVRTGNLPLLKVYGAFGASGDYR